jgi:hypothetical protein
VLESVWFTITPPVGGDFVSVDTVGSNYGHDISAWTGSPGNFVHLGCTYNGDGTYMLWPLSFPVSSSAPIHFMVSTRYMGTTGTLKFNLNVGPGFKLGSEVCLQRVGGRRGVAKVDRKWRAGIGADNGLCWGQNGDSG